MKTQLFRFVLAIAIAYLPFQIQAQSWVPQDVTLPLNYCVYSISVVDEDVVWGVAYDRTAGAPVPLNHIIKVLKTTNGGDSWTVHNVMQAVGRISFDIVAFDDMTAFITAQPSGNGLDAGVFKTTDGGAYWELIEGTGYTGSVWIRFFNQNDGIIINRQNMKTTADGGATWQTVPLSNIEPFLTDENTLISTGTNSVQVVGNNIWFGTSKGRVYRSSDKGDTWDAAQTSFGNTGTVISEAFRNPSDGIALDVSSTITDFSKTTDGGESWTNLNSSPGLRIRNMAYIPGTDGTVVGISDLTSSPITAYSTDFGETWKVVDEDIAFRPVQFINPTTGWAGISKITSAGQAAIYKWDGTDIFTCTPVSENFTSNTLTHTNTGSSDDEVSFSAGSKTPSFTISDLQAKINGNPNNRYIDEVTVTYVDGAGALKTYGTFSGTNTSSVQVDIISYVQSVKVSLTDGYDGNYGGNLSVTLSSIDYCDDNAPCPDDDGDGVCNVDDICPGYDDNINTDEDPFPDGCDLCPNDEYPYEDDDGDGVCNFDDMCPDFDDGIDVDNDGIPDDCDNCISAPPSTFAPNPRTHNGTGSASSTVYTNGNSDVTFTLNGLNAKTNGNPDKRYIEQVTITYHDGTDPAVPYDNANGTFSGDEQNEVNVSISGPVQSVTVSLTDIYDGDTGNEVMSVSMTPVSSCLPPPTPPALIQNDSGNSIAPESLNQSRQIAPSSTFQTSNEPTQWTVYPNPAQHELLVRSPDPGQDAKITLYNTLGITLGNYRLEGMPYLRINLNELQVNSQIILVKIQIPGESPVVKQIVVVK